MKDKEIFEKIFKSLDILNKSQAIQEKNSVVLFSYVYNLYIDQKQELEELKKINKDLTKKLNNVESKLKIVSHKKTFKEYIKELYDKIYKIIFKKKIEKQRLEQERIEREKAEEERKKREAENKKKIKEILKTTMQKK